MDPVTGAMLGVGMLGQAVSGIIESGNQAAAITASANAQAGAMEFMAQQQANTMQYVSDNQLRGFEHQLDTEDRMDNRSNFTQRMAIMSGLIVGLGQNSQALLVAQLQARIAERQISSDERVALRGIELQNHELDVREAELNNPVIDTSEFRTS